ncbi:MAG: O-antigen ligase family protein [Candidatus Levybacteria bacterium]|nr:O-antigen ligase family protein [Candidatus Levybacteria bacterium]
MDILKIIFAFIIALSWIFSQVIRVQLGNGLSLNILDILVGCVVATRIASLIAKKKLNLYFKDNIGKGILLFSGVAILSLVWNSPSLTFQQFIISGLYIIRWSSYAFLFILMREFNHIDKKQIKQLMFVTGIFFLVIGYMQFMYYGDLQNLFYLGWDEHMYRLFSVLLDPNFSGIFIILFLLFIVGKRLEMPVYPLTKEKLLLSVLIACTAGALILTFSRGAFISLVFAFTVFFFLIGKKRWIFIIIGIMLLIGIVLSQRFYIESINPFRTFSSYARLMSMREAGEMFFHQPVLGVGFNTYRYAQLRYGFRDQVNIETSHADAGTDNSFLFVLATTGIIGFAVYVALIITILSDIYKKFREERQIYDALVLSSVTGLCIASLFTNALFFPPLMLWMWIILGTIDYKKRDFSVRSG